jgi:hypothetical protein
MKNIKNAILKYFEKFGVPEDFNKLRLFFKGITMDPENPFFAENIIFEALFDFFGGFEKVNKYIIEEFNKTHTFETSNLKVNFIVKHWDMETISDEFFFIPDLYVYILPDSVVYLDGTKYLIHDLENQSLQNIEDMYGKNPNVDEYFINDLGQDISAEIVDYLYDLITKKTGVEISYVYVEGFVEPEDRETMYESITLPIHEEIKRILSLI